MGVVLVRVLSLFDGISIAQLALKELNIIPEVYYASEIEKQSILITQHHFPNTIQLGDVTKIDFSQFKDIDLICGGSPCTSFSISGKRTGFDGASGLIKYFFDAIDIIKPKYFFLENVVMKTDWEYEISKKLGCMPVLINSALVSAQVRKRLYWTNIPIDFPLDNHHVYLKDILESNVPERYYVKDQNNFVMKEPQKSNKEKQIRIGLKNGKNSQGGRLLSIDGKGNTLKTTSMGSDILLIDPETERKRRLTPLEYERLQTIPDNYTAIDGIGHSKRYTTVGNSWTLKVIQHLFKNLSKYNF